MGGKSLDDIVTVASKKFPVTVTFDGCNTVEFTFNDDAIASREPPLQHQIEEDETALTATEDAATTGRRFTAARTRLGSGKIAPGNPLTSTGGVASAAPDEYDISIAALAYSLTDGSGIETFDKQKYVFR
jgi:hypothetical protein